MPRIISGRSGGIQLVAPKGLDTRPTADKTKEALFSILTNSIPACHFLDLYAGTGQVGLEAASRGAARVILVEQAKSSLEAIAINLQKSRLSDVTSVRRGSAQSIVRQLVAEGAKFDLIFLDPPYRIALEDFQKLSADLVLLLQPAGRVILEHDASSIALDNVMELQRTRSCQYGTAMLSFYQI
ncbi:MAG: 16S rRNA (guanine(966)-N(2))-methyltransferase RsmD [Eubacteriales bacterium]|nr:16S rRNA (guanine(966)-N(2))-methyltransferase RsmD [Eubacteriales bacterium]